MEMQVGNERGPEAVDEDHQPEPRRRTRGCAARPQALLHRAHEQSQRRALERGATVHEVQQLLRHREHQLAHRHCSYCGQLLCPATIRFAGGDN